MSVRATARWSSTLAIAPSVGVAVLSKFTCSVCVAAYAGILSSLGLGALTTERGLTLFSAAFVVLNLGSLGWSVRRHRRLGPLMSAVIGSAILLLGRLWWPAPMPIYSGAALIVAASLWNLWAAQRPRPSVIQLGRTSSAGIN